jgi:formylglycine-generating enzyme required for sulfatase activity
MDTADISPGERFVQKLENELGACEVFLVLIGKRWLTLRGGAWWWPWRPRLKKSKDYVRLEIATALKRDIVVIPVLLDGARMPGARDLRGNIAGLAGYQGVELSQRHWDEDADRLVLDIERRLEEQRARRARLEAEQEARREKERTEPLRGKADRKVRGLKGVLLPGLISIPIIIALVGWVLYSQATVKKPEIPLVRVAKPNGTFQMSLENAGAEGAAAARSVTFSEPFYLGEHEVTQREWKDVMGEGNNPSQNKGDDLPVDGITLAEAHEFIHRLNARGTGYQFSLPTEAEWEYACKGWSSGDAIMGESAAAGSFPSAFKLYRHGSNIWEWCEDDYHESYDDAPQDGIFAWTGSDKGSPGVARIAEYNGAAVNFRCSSRRPLPRDEHSAAVGLRVVALEPIEPIKEPRLDLKRLIIIIMASLAGTLLLVLAKRYLRRLINFGKSRLGRSR